MKDYFNFEMRFVQIVLTDICRESITSSMKLANNFQMSDRSSKLPEANFNSKFNYGSRSAVIHLG